MTSTDIPPVSSPRTSGPVLMSIVGLAVGIGGLALGGLAFERFLTLEPLINTQQQASHQTDENGKRLRDTIKAQRDAVQQQQDTIAAMRKDIAALQDALTQREAQNIDEATLTARIEAALANKLGKDGAIDARIAALESAKAEENGTVLESSFDDRDARSVRYLMLQQQVLGGKPFQPELSRFTESLGDGIAEQTQVRAALDVLGNGQPIASKASLYRRFMAVPAVIRTEPEPYAPSEETRGWWKRSGDMVKGLVKIEKIEGVQSPHQRIDEARGLIKLGGIEEAVAAMDGLPEAERAAYGSWLDDAQRYVATEKALAVLRAAALTAHEPAKE